MLYSGCKNSIPSALQKRANAFELLHPECEILFQKQAESPGGKLRVLCNVKNITFSNLVEESNSAVHYMDLLVNEVAQDDKDNLDLRVDFPDHRKQSTKDL